MKIQGSLHHQDWKYFLNKCSLVRFGKGHLSFLSKLVVRGSSAWASFFSFGDEGIDD